MPVYLQSYGQSLVPWERFSSAGSRTSLGGDGLSLGHLRLALLEVRVYLIVGLARRRQLTFF
jgi:hypothetical protein